MAFALIILLFSFWSIVGFALVSALRERRNLLQNALLAPVAGLSATVLLVMWINIVIPLRTGGPVAAAILAALSVWLLRRSRPMLPVRRVLPFAGVLLLAALLTGYPAFLFGFNWISYGNDDMANYCLGAKLFLNHAQFSFPIAGDVIADRDISVLYWFFLVVSAIRHGAEETLGWVSSVTGLSPHQAFMPFILAMNLVLISASGALVLQGRKLRQAALLTCLALSLSALTTLGSTYQLLGQVAGLSTFTGACAVLLRPPAIKRSEMFFAALLGAGMGAFYPEVLPFFGASYILYHSLLLFRRKESLRRLSRNLLLTAAFSLVLLNLVADITGVTLAYQATAVGAAQDSGASLFPYYMTPAAFAYLWGLYAIGLREVGLVLDVAIILGAVLFVLALVAGFRLAAKGQPFSVIFLVFVAAALQLYRMRFDFGLYKIAMYMQPFLLGTVCVYWVQLFRKHRDSFVWRSSLLLAISLILVWGGRAQWHYTQRSLGDRAGGGLVEIPYASRQGLIAALNALPAGPQPPAVSDTSNVILAKILSLYRSPVRYLAKDFFSGFIASKSAGDRLNLYSRIYRDRSQELLNKRAAQFSFQSFDMHGALPEANSFQVRRSLEDDEQQLFLELGLNTLVLNRRSPTQTGPLIRVVPLAGKKNHLAFVSSTFGRTFDAPIPERVLGRVSMYQVEQDYFLPDGTMTSLGRVSLFRVLNASRQVRLVLEYTASLNADGVNQIPQGSVIGDRREPFAVAGRGSARLFSPPLQSQLIEDGQYVGLDMGSWGWRFPQVRSTIMSLWGADVLTDIRRIVGFTRDISLISDEQYAALDPPSEVRRFPKDLENKDLEYCGIYEDGWVAESSYFVLKNPENSGSLAVSFSIPNLNGRPTASTAALVLDGEEVERKSVTAGEVSFQALVQERGRHRIELRFDRAVSLPAPDNRPVSALIRHIGFQSVESGRNPAIPGF